MDAVGVYVTVHVAVAPVPDNVQVPVNVPTPLVVNVMVPVGVITVPGEVSVTVTVHVVGWLMATVEGVQVIDVVVLRFVTVMLVLPVLPE